MTSRVHVILIIFFTVRNAFRARTQNAEKHYNSICKLFVADTEADMRKRFRKLAKKKMYAEKGVAYGSILDLQLNISEIF